MIYLIYTKEQCRDAEEILRFLIEEKKLKLHSDDENCSILQSDNRIPEDTAIILVSNAAVEDKKWQALVDSILENMRLVPVSSTRNKDYIHPEKIPPRIKEINYIRMDEKYLENIWDSLIIEKEFYAIKSMLLLNINVWIFSKYSEDFLLTDRKKIRQYLLLFQQKLQIETNSYFREELDGIIKYLRFSMQYTKRLLRKKIIDYGKRISTFIVVIVSLVIYLNLLNYTNYLSLSATAIKVGLYEEVAPINAIKLVDSITNPFIDDTNKRGIYNVLSEYLNTNWHNTSIGANYKWALNDAQIAEDERYVWSANGNGNIAKWDTYTGRIIEQTNVSSQPLLAIAVTKNESLFVVVDIDGYVYKKVDGASWEKSLYSYDIPIHTKIKLVCDEKRSWAVVASTNGKFLWLDLRSGTDVIWEEQVDKIFCVELTDSGLEAVVKKNECLYDLYVHADGTVDEIRIPGEMDSDCSMDILNGMIVMADSNFQIVTWNRANPETIYPAGIILSRPICLCFLNDQVIIYNDRNTGTHLYDLKRYLDLGSILENAAIVSSLSASQNTVMACTSKSTMYSTENIKSLLPFEQINKSDICAIYTEKGMSSVGRIRQASIENDYMIRVALQLEEKNMTLMIDGANRYFIGQSQRDGSLVQEDDTDFSYYVDKPINFTGQPTIVGITNNGKTLLVGSSDGSFHEITFSETGDFLLGAQMQIPSYAAIDAIYQTPDCYYLEDITGVFWSVRIGYNSLTPEGAITAVKEKLHCATTEEIYDTVSKKTLEMLDVAIMPGGGNKEWE